MNSLCALLAATAIVSFLARTPRAEAAAAEPERLRPVGEAKGIHPGRVVWVHDPEATNWKGPGDGHWWEANHTSQERVNGMMSRAVGKLTGETTEAAAWDKLFRHHNRMRGKGDVGYKAGEKIAMKVNFVGFIAGAGNVNPETYRLEKQRDYMNTSPQMILAVLRQLVQAGVPESDISICDTLAYFANEYFDLIHQEFPKVQCLDHGGKLGRVQAQPSTVPFYWSSRPQDCKPDYLPTCFAEAEYVINLANLKAHLGTGVTLCAKNHYGSLIRTPVQKGYYDIHPNGFATQDKIYRPLVDLMGHAHFGGKTLLYLIDGLYPGIHPKDSAPRQWTSPPFNRDWASSLLASQDPVAIDSVGFDFLWTEYPEQTRKGGMDDYLHEAALAHAPPSGTFYDPDHPTNLKRLPSLGVHEHWNNDQDRQYSRNLGKGNGIELVAIELGTTRTASTAASGTQ